MSHTNGIIKAPVNIAADIGYVLGTNSGDIGYNITNGAMNIWPKYKPFRNASKGWDTTTSAGHSARKTALAAVNYGFTDPNIAGLPSTRIFDPSNANSLQKFYINSANDPSGKPLNGWQYYRPTSTPFRVLDFDGYRHGAGHPVAIAPGNAGTVSRQYQNTTFSFALAPLVHDSTQVFTGDDGQLTLADFPDLVGKYFGAVLQKNNDPSVRIFATGTQLSANTQSVSVTFTPYNFPSGLLGDFTAYFFFSDTQIPQGTSSESALVYPIPGVWVRTVTIVASLYTATISATKVGNSVRAEYTISNAGTSAHTFATNEMRCRYASVTSWNAVEDAAESAQNKDLGSITVAAGATATGVVNFTNIDSTLAASCRIWGKFGNNDEIAPFAVSPLTPNPA
ncbi:MAG: hypothetical protein J5639_09320 [Bacteroidales bacterium]|nr:hypothetical protein [Bacteroidales bacterium]